MRRFAFVLLVCLFATGAAVRANEEHRKQEATRVVTALADELGNITAEALFERAVDLKLHRMSQGLASERKVLQTLQEFADDLLVKGRDGALRSDVRRMAAVTRRGIAVTELGVSVLKPVSTALKLLNIPGVSVFTDINTNIISAREEQRMIEVEEARDLADFSRRYEDAFQRRDLARLAELDREAALRTRGTAPTGPVQPPPPPATRKKPVREHDPFAGIDFPRQPVAPTPVRQPTTALVPKSPPAPKTTPTQDNWVGGYKPKGGKLYAK